MLLSPALPSAADLWVRTEVRYAAARYAGTALVDDLDVLAGDVPVLLTAPHALRHPRAGTSKAPDMGTGGRVVTVATLAGARALVVAGPPSLDSTGPFKDALLELAPGVRAVIDVHGMNDSGGVDVCLGTGDDPRTSGVVVDVVREHLQRAGPRVGVDVPYDARRTTTVTSSVQAAGGRAVQVELARGLRDPYDAPEVAAALVRALTNAVADLART